ncbi:MAG: HEAT repeat domain-containing protein [bacterium]
MAAIESREAISSFAFILKNDSDYLLRMQSAISLSMIKDDRVILPLKEALLDREMVVKVASATGLIKMGRKDLVDKASKNDLSLKMYLEKWQQGF